MPQMTQTERDQLEVERTLVKGFEGAPQPLHRDAHVRMLRSCIASVADRFQGLHCSRPWLCYWTLHAADILGALDDVFLTTSANTVAQFIVSLLVSDDGEPSDAAADPVESGAGKRIGFGGGPGQMPHLAASYAAVCTLAICQDEAAVRSVDRDALQRWVASLRTADGGFRMHRGGEVDLRATYCAAVTATFFNLDMATIFPHESREYVVASQTYEGGFSSCLDGGAEAHGGYTQCAAGTAFLLGLSNDIDVDNLQRFCAMRQVVSDGGFCGRANKLVDSCYSFWIGGASMMSQASGAARKMSQGREKLTPAEILLLDYVQAIDLESVEMDVDSALQRPPSSDDAGDEASAAAKNSASSLPGELLFDQQEVMHYVLQNCQQPQGGGLRDKPSAGVDFYHTCYSLAGLSIASNNIYFSAGDTALLKELKKRDWVPTHTENPAAPAASDDDEPRSDGAAASSNDLSASLVQPYSYVAALEQDAMVGEFGPPPQICPPSMIRRAAGQRKQTRRTTGTDSSSAKPQSAPASTGAARFQLALRPVNPVFNVCRDKVAWMWRVFRGASAPMALLVA